MPFSAKAYLKDIVANLSEEDCKRLLEKARDLDLVDGIEAPCECPSCGECRLDHLEWNDDCDIIICNSCETCYDPNGVGSLATKFGIASR
jgi:hypothetical protein